MKEKIISTVMSVLILTVMFCAVLPVKTSSAATNGSDVSNALTNSGTAGPTSRSTSLNQINGFDNDWRRIFEKPLGTAQDAVSRSSSEALQSAPNSWALNTSKWGNLPYTDGNTTRLIVGVNNMNPTCFQDLEEILARYKAKSVNTVSIGGNVRAVVVELLSVYASSFAEDVRSVELANYVEPSMKVQAQFSPNDSYWNLQWGPSKIESDWAWNTTVGSHDVLVAVVDTGIDYTHPDLVSNYVPFGYDWVNLDSTPLDDNGHGTHVTGIIAATLNNSVGVAGLAQVRVMAEKVLDSWGSGYWDWVANGIVHAADQGAKIISMSLGGYGDSTLVHEAVRYAYSKGVLVIAAAGNDNSNMKLYPAGYDEVIAVAATDRYDYPAWFSNWGDWIELAAPGVDIYSTMPTYHVILNDHGFNMNYCMMSGTSMACPHVSGVAALVWSKFSDRSRDWVRMWLRYTADDLGTSGFDTTYGYGRVNARKAIEQTPPAHELIAFDWKTPPYVKTGTVGVVNATVLNFGESDESNLTVILAANSTIVNSAVIGSVPHGDLIEVSLGWIPEVDGNYNMTLHVVPVLGEKNLRDNSLSRYIYVGFPVKAVVLHSAGNINEGIITNWQALSSAWYLFGDVMVYIDYTTLNKDEITYGDIAATDADVLIISCAYDLYAGWQFTDSEIEAIERYVHEGHGLIATAGTFYNWVPNNNKLASLFGLNETTTWITSATDLLHLLDRIHPIFNSVPNPLVFPACGSALPYDGRWDSNELTEGRYLALGHYQESSIVTYKGLVYISSWLEIIPPYYYHHLQLLYNAMVWSRYQKPQHELVVSLETPKFLQPGKSVIVNSTVSNFGLNNETNVELQLWINTKVANVTIPKLSTGESYTVSYLWTPTVEGTNNITAYSPHVPNEEYTENNRVSISVKVLFVVARVAVLNSWERPPYFTGGLNNDYQPLVDALNAQDFYAEAVTDREIVDGILNFFDVLALVDNVPSEASVPRVVDFWSHGGGIVAFDSSICFLNYAGILPPESAGNNGYYTYWDYETYYQARVTSQHPVTEGYTIGQTISGASGDAEYRIDALSSTSAYPYYSSLVEDITKPDRAYVSAYEPPTSGRVVHIWDQFHWNNPDLRIMIPNAMRWVNTRYEHDLVATLDAPAFLEPNNSVLLDPTVRNRGLSNETMVELRLYINSTAVESTIIPQLVTGTSYTLDYYWMPTIEGMYNITVYATPLANETRIIDNKATRFTRVMNPLIRPVEGQYANYTIYIIDPNTGREITGGLWHLKYLHYISSQQVNVTMWTADNSNHTQGGWMIVNIFTRLVERDSGINWAGTWYPGWIETNVRIASTVDLLGGKGKIVDSRVIFVNGVPIDCWEIELEYYGWVYTFWYDRASGLWTGMMATVSYEVVQLALTATNVPIGLNHEHDLAVGLESPKRLQPGTTTTINATVYNTGLSAEGDVKLQLLINGSVIASHVAPELPSHGFYALTYLWTPESKGSYNVTVHASPVLGEEFVENNIKTRIVNVGPIEIALISEYSQLSSIGSILDSMGLNYDVFNSNAVYLYTANLSLLLEYKIVVFYKELRGIAFEEMSALNSYLYNGGSLIVTGFDSLRSDTRLADVVRSYSVGDDIDQPDLIVTNQFHPIMNGPYGSFLNGYHITDLYSDCDKALRDALKDSQSVAQLADGYDKIIATENIPGKVVFWNGRGDFDWTMNPDCQVILKNTVHWMLTKRDVAILSVTSSVSEVLLGDAVDIIVVAQNQGNTTETFTVTVNASSLNSTRIYLDPSSYLYDSGAVYIGYKFNVTAKVHDVRDLSSWQICIYYNDSTVNATRWFEPTWDPTYVFYGRSTWPLPSPPDVYHPRNNSVQIGSMLVPMISGEGFSGDGLLGIIEFEIEAVPQPGETLSSGLIVDNDDTCLLDSDVAVIPSVKENGYYALSSSGAPPPLPPATFYLVGTQIVVDLAPGAAISLTFSWNTSSVVPRSYRMSAKASVVQGELDTVDNLYVGGVIRVEKPPHASFVNFPEYPRAGQTVIFNASLSTPDGGVIVSYDWNFGDGINKTTVDPVALHVYAASGSYYVTLTIRDSDGLIDSTSKTVHVFIRDLAVVAVIPFVNRTYEGRTVSINVTVMNQGEVPENFTVTLYYNITAGDIIGTQGLENVLPGKNRTLTFNWNTAGVASTRDYLITAAASIMPAETDTADNTLSSVGSVQIRMLGDMDGDGKVVIKDLARMALAFGSYPGHYKWNPDADFNQDGKIDIRDIVIAAKNFGRS